MRRILNKKIGVIAAVRSSVFFVPPLAGAEPRKVLRRSGLLNVIDGIAAQEGSLMFMTTNQLDRLDPALIRPGRVDVKVEFSMACSDQLRGLYLRFFPDHQEAANEFSKSVPVNALSPAEVQDYLLQHASDPSAPTARRVSATACRATSWRPTRCRSWMPWRGSSTGFSPGSPPPRPADGRRAGPAKSRKSRQFLPLPCPGPCGTKNRKIIPCIRGGKVQWP